MQELLQQVETLAKQVQDLAAELGLVATAMSETGTLPGAELPGRLLNCVQQFTSLREQVLGEAANSGYGPIPPISSAADLASVAGRVLGSAPILDVRRRALRVLERVLCLDHIEQQSFPPLMSCQLQAQALYREMAAVEPPELHAQAEALADGTDPLVHLVTLVEQHASLDDDHWQILFDLARPSLGVPLAVAASRGKLTIREKPVLGIDALESCGEPEESPPPGGGAPVSVDTTAAPESTGAQTPDAPAGLTPAEPARNAEPDEVSPEPHEPTQREADAAVAPAEQPEPEGRTPPTAPGGGTGPQPTPAPASSAPGFGAAMSARDVAAAIRALPGPLSEKSNELADLAWRLLRDDRPGLAGRLAQYLEASTPVAPRHAPHAWVIRAAGLGCHLYRAGGEMERRLKDELANFSPDVFASGQPEFNHAIRFLLAAAAMQPALLAPAGAAPHVLRSLHMKEGLGSLYRCLQAIADYGDQQQPLDPSVLKGLKDRATWQEQMDALRREVEAWCLRAESFTINYAPATKVWRKWLEPQGVLYQLLLPLRQDKPERLDETLREADRLSDEAELRREVDHTDRLVRGGRIREPIMARALSQLVQRTGEAVRLVRRWHQMLESREGDKAGYLQERTDALRREMLIQYDQAMAELDSFVSDHPDVATTAAAGQCRNALAGIRSLFDPVVETPAAEPDPRHVLDVDLLHMPALPLDEDWQPVGVSAETLVSAILDQVAGAGWSWEHALNARTDARDHMATGEILEYLEAHPTPEVNLEQLRRARDKHLQECRAALAHEVEFTQKAVEEAVAYGVLQQDDRTMLSARIVQVEADLPAILRFQEGHSRLAEVRKEIEVRRDAEVEAVRRRLSDTLIDASHPSYPRIAAVLEKGNILEANEYVEMIRAGEEIPVAGELDEDSFPDFFPTRALELEDSLEAMSTTALVKAIRKREAIKGINMYRVPGKQAEQAGDLMEAWFNAKNAQRVQESVAQTILTHLGFNPAQVSVHRSARRTWIHLKAEPIRDKNRCPVPQFGSAANGNYRILCVWDRPTEEDLINDVGDTAHGTPILVFHFGRMTIQRRRDMARLCRERRRTFLVIDDTLVLYLCGVRGSRLPVLFACALPFTFLEPYVTTAGSVPPEMFYGRERERDAIVSLGPGDSCFIYGGRQLGKTALLREVARSFHSPGEGKIAAWIDLKVEGIGHDRQVDDIWSLIALQMKKAEVLPVSLSARSNPDRILDGIATWLGSDPLRRVLLLLDEADRFLESDGRDDFRRTARIKGLMDKTNRQFKVVFAGLHNVLRTTRQQNNPLAHLGDPICIGPLLDGGDWRHARGLVERPLQALGYWSEDPDLVTRILSQTNYYPSLIQLYCNQLLRHVSRVDAASFDLKNSPPYMITPRHVQEAYRSQELRDAIRHRFRLTLQLDPRYEVIAYAIAYYSLSADRRGLADGFPPLWIRQQALSCWPDGFRDGAPEDAFRVLLEEMVGLGVLRRAAEGRYALRSPNVALLMGTQEEILAELHLPREAPPEYEPGTFRSVFRSDGAADLSRRSPLTAQQESELRGRSNGVSIVFGCPAAGLEALESYLRMAFGPEYFMDLSGAMDRKSFVARLDGLGQRESDGTTAVFVPAMCPWADTWVDEALQRVLKLKSRTSFVRVIFVADPTVTWRLVADYPDGFESLKARGMTIFGLRPWHDAALRQWLEDNGFTTQGELSRAQVYAVTGRWPLFLRQLYDISKADPHRWEQSLQKLAAAADGPQLRAEWAQSLGINRTEVRQVLRALVILDSDQATAEDLAGVIDDLPAEVVHQTLHWAELMGLCRQSGDRSWAVDDPVTRRILAKAGESDPS